MWPCRLDQRLLAVVATTFVVATRAANSCFQNDPPYRVVRGQPFVLTWVAEALDDVVDLSLATSGHTSLGYLARNITQTSLSWTPPLNITSEPLSFLLFQYNRQSTCFSANFTIAGTLDTQFETPSASLATTVVTNNMVASTVTATVGIWTPNAAASTTATATPTNAVPITTNSSESGVDSWKIGVGVTIGILVLIVSVLGAFLWRTRRKKRDMVTYPEIKEDTKTKTENDSYRSSAYTAADELDGAHLNELPASDRAQLDGSGKPAGWNPGLNYCELNANERYEADGQSMIAELPGDEPAPYFKKEKKHSE